MKHLKNYTLYKSITEGILPVTANWFIVSNESTFDKKEGGGYFIFNQKGIFTIAYKKPGVEEEGRLDFYVSKESSPSKCLCQCKIIDKKGTTVASKNFEDITAESVWDILALFFDYCDIEKSSKEESERFMLGLAKSLKNVLKDDSSDQLPSSFLAFEKLINDGAKLADPKIKLDLKKDNFKFEEIVLGFIKFLRKIS